MIGFERIAVETEHTCQCLLLEAAGIWRGWRGRWRLRNTGLTSSGATGLPY